MKVRSLVVFGLGYVAGSRAGRERYGQIVALAQKSAQRLEAYANDHNASRTGSGSGSD